MLARPVFVFWVYINLITVGCKTMKNALQKSLPDIVHYLWNIGFGKPGHIIPNCTIKSLLIFIHWNDLRCISSFYVSLDNRSILINMHNCKFLTSEYGKKRSNHYIIRKQDANEWQGIFGATRVSIQLKELRQKVLNLIYNRLWADLYLFMDTYKHDEDDEVWSRD